MTRKRLLLWLGLPLLLVLLGAALLYGFRRDVAAWAIDRELAKLGLQGSLYHIVALDPDGAVFTNLTLPNGSIAAQKVTVSYNLLDLVGGQVERIEIVGLRAAPNFLDNLPGGGSDSDSAGADTTATPAELPEIVLTDAKVGLRTPLGVVSASFDLKADATGTAIDLRATLPDALAGVAGVQTERSDLDVTAQGTLPPLRELLDASGETLANQVTFTGAATLAVQGLTLPGAVERLDLALPLSLRYEPGSLVFAHDAAGDIGSLQLPGLDPGTLSLAAGPLLRLRILPDGYGVALTPDLRFALASGPWLRISTTAETDLGTDFTPGAITLGNLIAEGEAWVFDAHEIERFSVQGTLAGTTEALQGPLDVNLSLTRTIIGSFPIEGLTLAGPFQTTVTPSRLTMVLTEPAPATLRQAYNGEAPLLPESLRATMEQSNLLLDWADGLLRLEHDTILQLGPQRITFGMGDTAMPITGDFGRMEVTGRTHEDFAYSGNLHLMPASIELPSYGLKLEGVDLAWAFPMPGEATPPHPFSVAKVSVTTGMGTLAGMTLEGQILESESGLAMTGKGRGPGGTGALAVALEEDSTTGKGKLTADWGPIAFKPGGPQPGSILSFLKDFKEVSGTVKAILALSWTAERSSSELALTLTDLSFQHPQAAVEGLNGKIVLDSLTQLSTRPAKLTAKRIDIGTPLTDLTTTLRIKPGRSPTFVLSDTAFTLVGGQFLLPSVEYSDTAKLVTGTVTIQGLDLAELGRELAVEDLSLEGRMNGTLPFSYGPADESVAVSSGNLTATGPGVIRYGKAGTAEIRAGGDSNFALALQALEDFQFKIFSLSFDKAADGRTQLGIRLEGANPAVLDGYPFRLNINLQTDLAQVLQALRDGYRLNPNLFKGGWTFQ